MTNHQSAISKDSTSPLLVTGISLTLLLMVAAVFGQTFGFEFVNYDDPIFVTENSHVLRGLNWENLRWVMTAGIGRDATDTDFWRPLSLLSHMADVSLFGLKAGGHHAVSVAIHAATSVLLFLVLRSMTGALWRSAFVAALFAIHPLHVESVAWVAERKDVLSALFFVLTLGAYARYAKSFKGAKWTASVWNYLLVMLLFALALMSKPMVVTLPFVLLLLDYWPLKRSRTLPLWKLLLEKIPLFAMSAIVAMLTTGGPGFSSSDSCLSLSWFSRMVVAISAYGTYLGQSVWPSGLTPYYQLREMRLEEPSVLLSAMVLLIVTGFALWQRSRRYLAVGWLWYLGMLVPVAGILQTTGSVAHADHYTYLPLIGLFLAVTWLLYDWKREYHLPQALPAIAAFMVLGLLIFVARENVSHWRDSKALWSHALECTENNALAHNNLGQAFLEQGDWESASRHYKTAVTIKPDYAEGQYNLANTLFQNGDLQQSILHFRLALESDPSFAGARNNYAAALLQQGNTGAAVEQFEKSLELEPENRAFANNLAWILATAPDVAFRNGARALELARMVNAGNEGNNPSTLRTLAAAYAQAGFPSEAAQTARNARAAALSQNNIPMAETLAKEESLYAAKKTFPYGN